MILKKKIREDLSKVTVKNGKFSRSQACKKWEEANFREKE